MLEHEITVEPDYAQFIGTHHNEEDIRVLLFIGPVGQQKVILVVWFRTYYHSHVSYFARRASTNGTVYRARGTLSKHPCAQHIFLGGQLAGLLHIHLPAQHSTRHVFVPGNLEPTQKVLLFIIINKETLRPMGTVPPQPEPCQRLGCPFISMMIDALLNLVSKGIVPRRD